MRVRMNIAIGGTRDGAEWPAPGGTIDVSAHEAETLVAHGYAELVPVEAATATPPETAAARTGRPKGRKPSRGRD